MTEQNTTTDLRLDAVTLVASSGSTTTLRDVYDTVVDGFHWWAVTAITPRVRNAQRREAVGVADGDLVVRGYVTDVTVSADGTATLSVAPPA